MISPVKEIYGFMQEALDKVHYPLYIPRSCIAAFELAILMSNSQ